MRWVYEDVTVKEIGTEIRHEHYSVSLSNNTRILSLQAVRLMRKASLESTHLQLSK